MKSPQSVQKSLTPQQSKTASIKVIKALGKKLTSLESKPKGKKVDSTVVLKAPKVISMPLKVKKKNSLKVTPNTNSNIHVTKVNTSEKKNKKKKEALETNVGSSNAVDITKGSVMGKAKLNKKAKKRLLDSKNLPAKNIQMLVKPVPMKANTNHVNNSKRNLSKKRKGPAKVAEGENKAPSSNINNLVPLNPPKKQKLDNSHKSTTEDKNMLRQFAIKFPAGASNYSTAIEEILKISEKYCSLDHLDICEIPGKRNKINKITIDGKPLKITEREAPLRLNVRTPEMRTEAKREALKRKFKNSPSTRLLLRKGRQTTKMFYSTRERRNLKRQERRREILLQKNLQENS